MDVDWDSPTTWPDWLTAPITLAEPDARWLRAGGAEAARLTHLLGDMADGPVEHIGSTAVPGLRAKPVLDFAVASAQRDAAAKWMAAALGPDWVLVPDRLHPLPVRLLIRVVDDRRHTHLQILHAGDPHLERLVGFRDALQADIQARRAYEHVKNAAAEAHGEDRARYTARKAEIVASILRGVGIEPAEEHVV